MTISFTGTGSLFKRIAEFVRAIESANNALGTGDLTDANLLSAGVATANIEAQYLSTNQDIISGIRTELASMRTSLDGWKGSMRTFAEQTIIDMINDDNPQPTEDLESALVELDRQMVDNSQSVDASTVSATATADGDNTGDAAVVVSVKRPDGRSNELILAEDIVLTCTGDAQTGGTATAAQEEWTFAGEVTIADALSTAWPGGSGASGTVNAVDAAQDATGGNLLTNSDFEDFTSNVPDDWTKLVGTAGTDVLQEVSVVFKGTKALKFTGTSGGVLSSIAQTLSSDQLVPNAVLHFNCWAKKSADLDAGVVEVSLIDGNDAYITDDAGNNLAATVAHDTLTTSFAQFSGAFTLPKVLPTTLKIRVRVSTALTDGESVYIDHLSLAVPDQMYDGGPYLSVHSGATNSIIDDEHIIAVTNDRAGSFQEWFDRLFDMRGKGLQIRSNSAGGETIADTLITTY